MRKTHAPSGCSAAIRFGLLISVLLRPAAPQCCASICKGCLKRGPSALAHLTLLATQTQIHRGALCTTTVQRSQIPKAPLQLTAPFTLMSTKLYRNQRFTADATSVLKEKLVRESRSSVSLLMIYFIRNNENRRTVQNDCAHSGP